MEPKGTRHDGGGAAKNEKYIEDVGADDVAETHVGMAFGGGDERGGELGERSACGKDGESDQSFAPAEAARYGRRAVDKPVAAQYETAETADGDEDGAPQWTGFFVSVSVLSAVAGSGWSDFLAEAMV